MDLESQIKPPSVEQQRADRAMVVRNDLKQVKEQLSNLKQDLAKIDGSLIQVENNKKAEIEKWLIMRCENLTPLMTVSTMRVGHFGVRAGDQRQVQAVRQRVMAMTVYNLPKGDPFRSLREEYDKRLQEEVEKPKAALSVSKELVLTKVKNLDQRMKDLMFEQDNIPGVINAPPQETQVVADKGLPVAEVSQMVASLPAIERLSPTAAAMVTAQAAQLIEKEKAESSAPAPAPAQSRSKGPLFAAGAVALYFLTKE